MKKIISKHIEQGNIIISDLWPAKNSWMMLTVVIGILLIIIQMEVLELELIQVLILKIVGQI